MSNEKRKGKIIPVHAMKVYEEVKVWLHYKPKKKICYYKMFGYRIVHNFNILLVL